MGTLEQHIDLLKEAGKQCPFIPELFEHFLHISEMHVIDKDNKFGKGIYLIDPTSHMSLQEFLKAIEAPLPPLLPPRRHFNPATKPTQKA
jgi:hypothetical protein